MEILFSKKIFTFINFIDIIILKKGEYVMHWIDIVVLAILIIFAFVGMRRGLIDAVLSLFNTLVSILIAFWASKPFAGFLEQCFKVTSWLSKNIANMLSSWSSSFGTAVESSITGTQAIEASSLSGWQQTILKLMVDECVIEAGSKPADMFANILAPVALIVISGIFAFILIKVAVFLLSKLFDALLKSRTLKSLDRLLGFVLGAVKGALIICVIMGITIFIPNDKIITEIDKTQITKIAYQPVTDFIRVNIADKLQAWAEDIMPDETPSGTSYVITFNKD